MAGGDERKGKEPAVAAEDKFPEGMRVLAVDDDNVCRKILELQLRVCKFNPTMVSDARTALEMLREGGEEQFDLVITDVHMPDMDGFKLLELIGLEMDLPVIMLSVNGEKETVLKGITHGACDYLVKPVHVKELKHIWQHVIRKNPSVMNHGGSDSDDADQRVVQPVIDEGKQGGAKTKKCSKKKKKKHDEDDSDENKESMSMPTTRNKKPRISWTGELHGRFLEVVNELGVDKAVPKTILQLMDVDYLSRESVASHLQKYRLYLKRVTDDPRKPNPFGNSFQRRNSSFYMNMYHQGNSINYNGHQTGWPSSTVGFPGSNVIHSAPSVLGAQDVPHQSMNWNMGTVGHGRGMPRHAQPWLPDTIRRDPSGPPVLSFTNISSHHTMLDAFPPSPSSKAYVGVLCEKLMEASNVKPSSLPGNSSLAEMANGVMFEPPVNQLSVQPPGLVSQFPTLLNTAPSAVGGVRPDTQLQYLAGSSSNPWQNMAPSSFHVHMDGSGTPLAQSQVNFPQINQLPSFGASPGQMPMFQNEQQNQLAGINHNNNNISVGAFSEQMTPLFNMASKTSPVEMTHDNFSPMTQMVNGGRSSLPNLQTGSSLAPLTQMVNGGSINATLPDLQDSSVVPTQMLNIGDASGILPVLEDPTDQQVVDDQQALDDQQPNYSNPFFPEDIFTSVLNQDFNDDAFFGGEY